MKTLANAVLSFLLIIFYITACATLFPDIKIRPSYTGVDPKLQPIVQEYLDLSALNHLTFPKEVTAGFTHLKSPNVIGQCTYGAGWREIDVDKENWDMSTPNERLALMFHELNHCYCSRPHDFGTGQKYPTPAEIRAKRRPFGIFDDPNQPGHMEDGCPTSLMYPILVDSDCFIRHYEHYTSEMFNRCEPYGK